MSLSLCSCQLRMVECLHMYSQNCRGLNSFEKRHNLFQYVRKKKYDIICLLNIHIEEKMENFVKMNWVIIYI